MHTERFDTAARTALANQQDLDAGLSEGTLLKSFVSSSSDDLKKALECGKQIPTKAG